MPDTADDSNAETRNSLDESLSALNADDITSSIEKCSQAILLNPADASTFRRRGTLHARQGALDAAIVDFNMAIQVNPNDAQSYYFRGLAHERKLDPESAIWDYDKALSLKPQHIKAQEKRASIIKSKEEASRLAALRVIHDRKMEALQDVFGTDNVPWADVYRWIRDDYKTSNQEETMALLLILKNIVEDFPNTETTNLNMLLSWISDQFPDLPEENRIPLLNMFHIVMETTEKRIRADRIEEFRKIRSSQYLKLLSYEFMKKDGNVDLQKIGAVGERELASGRASSKDEFLVDMTNLAAATRPPVVTLKWKVGFFICLFVANWCLLGGIGYFAYSTLYGGPFGGGGLLDDEIRILTWGCHPSPNYKSCDDPFWIGEHYFSLDKEHHSVTRRTTRGTSPPPGTDRFDNCSITDLQNWECHALNGRQTMADGNYTFYGPNGYANVFGSNTFQVRGRYWLGNTPL
jgi:tetratricopeptide (TPR) repeat protein